MADRRVLSFSERSTILRTLLEINNRAKTLYDTLVREKREPTYIHDAVRDILEDAETLAANLDWYPQITVSVATVEDIVGFTSLEANRQYTARVTDAAGTGTSAAWINAFGFLETGDKILIKDSAQGIRNGEWTVTAVDYYYFRCSGGPAWATYSDIETEVEFVLYQKSV